MNKNEIVEKINGLTAKANERKAEIDKINKAPDYKGRFDTLKWTAEPGVPNVTRQRGERPYSLIKVAQLARNQIDEDSAVEEINISNKLATAYAKCSFSPAHAEGKSWLIPMYTDYLPKDTSANEALVNEIKQKMYLPKSDMDEFNSAVSKGWKIDKTNWGTIADSFGGDFTQPAQIFELAAMQYKLEAFSRAGASQIPMWPNGRAMLSKIATGSTAFYADEGVNFAASLSNQTSQAVHFVAKKVAVLIAINNEALRFQTNASEQMLRMDMARQAALFADQEMFTGTGGTHLKGLLTYPLQTPPWTQGNDQVINYNASPNAPAGLGTNGNTFQPQDVDLMCNELPDEVSADAVTFLMTRLLYGGISSRRASALSAGDNAGVFVGQRLIGITDRIPENVEGYKTVWSSNIPTNLCEDGRYEFDLCHCWTLQ